MIDQAQPTPARPVPGPTDAGDRPRYVVEASPRRIRVMLGGDFVADSAGACLLFETGKLPVYYFPQTDVRAGAIVESGHSSIDPVKGPTTHLDVRGGGRVAERAAWRCAGDLRSGVDLQDLVAFDWNSMDAWFEEDEQVFVHARDPYHRVDAVESSRRVAVSIDGVTVAQSTRPVMVFETGLPPRYYLPKVDVRLELLEPSDLRTACPYKGTAGYFGVRTGSGLSPDIVWCYEAPIPEAPKIAGRLCFFDERVEMTVDGVVQERPRTRWS